MHKEYEEDTQIPCCTTFGLKESGFLNTMALMEQKNHIKSKTLYRTVMAADIPLHFPLRTNQSQRAPPALYQLTSIRQPDIRHANTFILAISRQRGQ